MPIYEYKCAECQHTMDVLQRMSDPLKTECPECGASALEKQVTAAAFHLKGTGWYETDFKNSGKKPPEGDDKSSDKKSSDSTTADADNKSKSDKAASKSETPAKSTSTAKSESS